jgi:hypothetical protein
MTDKNFSPEVHITYYVYQYTYIVNRPASYIYMKIYIVKEV